MPTEGEKSPEAENNNNNNKKGKTGGSQVKHAYPNREAPKLLAFKIKCSTNSISCSGHLSLGWVKHSWLGAIFLLPRHGFCNCILQGSAAFHVIEALSLF